VFKNKNITIEYRDTQNIETIYGRMHVLPGRLVIEHARANWLYDLLRIGRRQVTEIPFTSIRRWYYQTTK
jgi:hypothetical protein